MAKIFVFCQGEGMMFPINTKNHIEFGKCGKTTKVTNKEKNMNSSEAVRVDISETGMQMIENRNIL